MYSPKISEALIPRIYRAAKEAKIPMTSWVNQVVERALPEPAVSPPESPMVLNALDLGSPVQPCNSDGRLNVNLQ